MDGSDYMPESGGVYYDRQEVRRPAEREQAIFHALPGLVHHAMDNTPFFAKHLAGVVADSVDSREALAKLPILRRADILAMQREAPPFGGLHATPVPRLGRIFASPGPVYDPEGIRVDYWRFARAMFAAGIRPGDLVHNCFSYHLTPFGSMAENGARALSCPVVAAGPEQIDLQCQMIQDLRTTAYAGPPAVLLRLLERGAELGTATGSLSKALVSGDAFTAVLRDRLQAAFGVTAYECYASGEIGLIAYETKARQGLVVDESIILEIVRPGTGEPLPDGEVGEIVVTNFNPDYPLIRFATGDLSAVVPGESPCGRTNLRIAGLHGRVGQDGGRQPAIA